MGRLTERFSDGTAFVPNCVLEFTNGMAGVINKLADYEDAEEQGLLIKLPCKVGTPVYMVEQGCGRDALGCMSGACRYCRYLYRFVEEIKFYEDMRHKIGKIVFLTKEEAEQALKQMGE